MKQAKIPRPLRHLADLLATVVAVSLSAAFPLPCRATSSEAHPPFHSSTPHTFESLETKREIKIVCFGDSTTGIYYHTGSRRAWPEMLGVALRRAYPSAQLEVVNAGVSGNNTEEALARLETDVLQLKPQLVIVMFGLNDIASLSRELFRANMSEIIRRVRTASSEVLVVTPNPISPDDPRRPPARLADYVGEVRRLCRDMEVPLVDTYQLLGALQLGDRLRWEHMMSDSIHPNMFGHKFIAEELAYSISGQRISLREVPLPRPTLAKVYSRLQSHQPLRVVAMKPYDTLVAQAIRRLYPDATVQVTPWPPDLASLSAIDAQAQAIGWMKYYHRPDVPKPDLFLVAIPASARAAPGDDYFRRYKSIMNWSCAFTKGDWDCLVALPSFAMPEGACAQSEEERLAVEVIQSSDLPCLERQSGDRTPPSALLTVRLREMLAPR